MVRSLPIGSYGPNSRVQAIGISLRIDRIGMIMKKSVMRCGGNNISASPLNVLSYGSSRLRFRPFRMETE